MQTKKVKRLESAIIHIICNLASPPFPPSLILACYAILLTSFEVRAPFEVTTDHTVFFRRLLADVFRHYPQS